MVWAVAWPSRRWGSSTTLEMRQALSAQLLGSHLDVQMWSWVGGTRTAQKTPLWEKEAQTLC